MWTRLISNSSVVTTFDYISKHPESAASAYEFIFTLESIKHIDGLGLNEKARLIDVIAKLKSIGVNEVYTEELDQYRIIRNGLCHNKEFALVSNVDKYFYSEYSELAYNLIRLIIKDIIDRRLLPNTRQLKKLLNYNLDSKMISESNIFGNK